MWQETMGFWDGSGISWTICKQSAPRTRHITTSTPHHSIFYRPDALPDAQPTVSKHIKSTYWFVNTWVNPTVLKTTSRTILLHLFNGLFSRTSRYQKGKTSLNLHEATEDGFWEVLASAGAYANNLHLAPTAHHSIFTGRMFFLMPKQQC